MTFTISKSIGPRLFLEAGHLPCNSSTPKIQSLFIEDCLLILFLEARALEKLISDGHAVIADAQHPLQPASAGSLYLTQDQKILIHRRDKGAPIHALYHSSYSGFSQSHEFVFSVEGLMNIALSETAEECLLITRDKKPWLIVPEDAPEYTLASAKNLGIDLPARNVRVEMLPAKDTLEVYHEQGEFIFKAHASLSLLWESATSLSALWIRKLPLSAAEVYPIDAEGMMKDGKFVQL